MKAYKVSIILAADGEFTQKIEQTEIKDDLAKIYDDVKAIHNTQNENGDIIRYCITSDKNRIGEIMKYLLDSVSKDSYNKGAESSKEASEEGTNKFGSIVCEGFEKKPLILGKIDIARQNSFTVCRSPEKRIVTDIYMGQICFEGTKTEPVVFLAAMKVDAIPANEKCPSEIYRVNIANGHAIVRETTQIEAFCYSDEKCPIAGCRYILIETKGSFYTHVILSTPLVMAKGTAETDVIDKMLNRIKRDSRFITAEQVTVEPPHVLE
jgi:hypothetical protein